MIWVARHPRAHPRMLGYLAEMVSEDDPRAAKEQFNENYEAGWRPFHGFRMAANGSLLYPDDPPMLLLFETRLRQETIRLYEFDWVAILQPDGSFEVCRMD